MHARCDGHVADHHHVAGFGVVFGRDTGVVRRAELQQLRLEGMPCEEHGIRGQRQQAAAEVAVAQAQGRLREELRAVDTKLPSCPNTSPDARPGTSPLRRDAREPFTREPRRGATQQADVRVGELLHEGRPRRGHTAALPRSAAVLEEPKQERKPIRAVADVLAADEQQLVGRVGVGCVGRGTALAHQAQPIAHGASLGGVCEPAQQGVDVLAPAALRAAIAPAAPQVVQAAHDEPAQQQVAAP